jgi:hypothetical protein
MVGHLRDEKSPQTLFEAARILKDSPDILIDHIGESLDASLGSQARATAAACPGYRWLGGLSHETTRRHIQRAHLLVHTSRMEGGAHVIMEAVCSGTPVSRIAGNVGMLVKTPRLAHGDQGCLLRCREDPAALAPNTLYAKLEDRCARRVPLFAPETERAALTRLVHDLLK